MYIVKLFIYFLTKLTALLHPPDPYALNIFTHDRNIIDIFMLQMSYLIIIPAIPIIFWYTYNYLGSY